MFQLIMVENALALEIKTDGKMIATSRAKGDPFKVAKRNGWTFQSGNGTKGARRAALLDVISIRVANDPNYTPGQYVTDAVGQDDVDRAVARGQRWKVTGEPTPDFV